MGRRAPCGPRPGSVRSANPRAPRRWRPWCSGVGSSDGFGVASRGRPTSPARSSSGCCRWRCGSSCGAKESPKTRSRCNGPPISPPRPARRCANPNVTPFTPAMTVITKRRTMLLVPRQLVPAGCGDRQHARRAVRVVGAGVFRAALRLRCVGRSAFKESPRGEGCGGQLGRGGVAGFREATSRTLRGPAHALVVWDRDRWGLGLGTGWVRLLCQPSGSASPSRGAPFIAVSVPERARRRVGG